MKRFLFALSAILSSAILFAEDLDQVLSGMLPAKTVKELRAQGVIQHSVYRDSKAVLELAPDTALAAGAAAFWAGDQPPFFCETLYLYEKPSAHQGAAGDETEEVAVILRSLSRLEGLEYFSTSRQKMRTLYASSYAVKGPDSREKIVDPAFGNADGQTIYAVQKDLTFGEYLYRYDYRETDDSVAFYSRNVDGLKYTLFKLINPERMRISLVVQDLGSHLLIYSLTRVDFLAVPGIEGKINASFTTRAEAMYRWFINEYERS